MSGFPTRILAATDGSEDAILALRAAADLSSRTGSELHVAVGSRGLNAARRAVLGSVSAAVLRSAGCQVLIVRSEKGGRDDAP